MKIAGMRKILLAFLISFMLVGAPDGAGAQAQPTLAPMPELTIAMAVSESVFALPYVAEANGYFKDAGVKVNFLNNVGMNVLNFIASGQADVTYFGTALAFSMVARGKPTSVIYNFSGGGIGGMVLANKPYKDVMELSGKRVGTLGVNGGSYGFAQFYSQYIQKRGGTKFDIVPFADPATLVNSVKSGQVDAATSQEGLFAAAEKAGGIYVVVDTKDATQRAKYIGPYVAENSMFGATDVLQVKRDAVVRYLRGIDKALAWVRSHSPEELAALLVDKSPTFKSIPLETELVSTRYTSHFWSPERGRISEDMWNRSLPLFALWNLQGVDVTKPEFAYGQRVDMSYLDEALKP